MMDEAELERTITHKRKHVRTLYDRLKIVEEVENNPNEKRINIAKRLGLSASTLNSIFAKKNELRELVKKCGDSCKKRKSGKLSTYAELETVLFAWYQHSKASDQLVDGNALKEKAKIIADMMSLDNFTASNGWVSRFRERHGLTLRKPVMENSIKEDKPDKIGVQGSVMCTNSLMSLSGGYEPWNIYSADETGLFFNLLPDEVSLFQEEFCPNGNHQDRLTVMLCVNSDGSDRQVPIIVGKFLKPRCFKSVTEIPIKYYANPNAWMTTKIFCSFLHSLDEEMVKQNRQIILFADDCSSHKTDTSSLRNVKVVHHSDKCSSLNSDIIYYFKANYRKCLMESMRETQRTVELLEALQHILTAWQKVNQKTIKNCFRNSSIYKYLPDGKMMVNGDDNYDDGDNDSLLAWEEHCTAQNYDFQSYISVDRDIATTGFEIIEDDSNEMFVESSRCRGDADDDIVNDDEQEPMQSDDEQEIVPRFAEAYDALQKIKEFFFMHNGNDKDFENILNLEKSYFHLRQNSSARRRKTKAVEELMMEAKKGRELAERIGMDGWKKSNVKVNKRFLTAEITNSIASNNRLKRTKKSQSPRESPSEKTSKTEKNDLKRSNPETNEKSSPEVKKRKSTQPHRFDKQLLYSR